eukprot:4798835-Pyramimonas_sp.AAC.1
MEPARLESTSSSILPSCTSAATCSAMFACAWKNVGSASGFVGKATGENCAPGRTHASAANPDQARGLAEPALHGSQHVDPPLERAVDT